MVPEKINVNTLTLAKISHHIDTDMMPCHEKLSVLVYMQRSMYSEFRVVNDHVVMKPHVSKVLWSQALQRVSEKINVHTLTLAKISHLIHAIQVELICHAGVLEYHSIKFILMPCSP